MSKVLKLFRNAVFLNKEEIEIRQAIKELRSMNDRELTELGLARTDIKAAVRKKNKAA